MTAADKSCLEVCSAMFGAFYALDYVNMIRQGLGVALMSKEEYQRHVQHASTLGLHRIRALNNESIDEMWLDALDRPDL